MNIMNDEGHALYVQTFYHGGMTSFEIIPDGGHYCIAADGKIIAEVRHNPDWEQISGEQLPKDTLESIYQQIEQKKS